MENTLKVKSKPAKVLAMELFALQPSITAEQVAQSVGVNKSTINSWRSDPNFLDACYDRYMIEFGSQLPSVLNAMVREAQAGNVQAGRLVLEHSGKLVKNINITVDSPFEKFLKAVPDAEVVEDAEIIEAACVVESDFETLPSRNENDQNVRVRNENVLNRKAIEKEDKRLSYNEKQKEWYKWRTRAKKVEVEPLKGRRPTPAQRQDWIKLIVAAELTHSE